MLTIFTVPKPFTGLDAVIQRNAINSWLRLDPKCQILLFGDEPGISEISSELAVTQIPNVPKTELGTPTLDFVFERAQQMADHEIVCYVNADIMLLSDLPAAIRQLSFERYLMGGQRWDLDLPELWNFETDSWEQDLRDLVARDGALHPPSGADFFIFPKGAFQALPPFAVGRPGWDNWLISHARVEGVPVIDSTPAVTAIHQNHGYQHVPGRKNDNWRGSPESEENMRLTRPDFALNIKCAEWTLAPTGLRRPKWTIDRVFQSAISLAIFYPRLRPLVSFGRSIRQRA